MPPISSVERWKIFIKKNLLSFLPNILKGQLGSAGLGVSEGEQQVPEALYGMEQVVLQPHQTSATRETREAIGQIVLANLAAQFAGKPPPTAVVQKFRSSAKARR